LLALAKADQQERRRLQIVKELLSTEEHYVQALSTISKVFLKPLRGKYSGLLSPEKIRYIFGNIEQLLAYHKKFSKAMKERVDQWSSEQLIGDLFVNEASFLIIYSDYVTNYLTGNDTLKKEQASSPAFASFVKKREAKPECKFQDIESFLIQPIQRIPRYNLLLQDLTKHTDQSHDDFSDLNRAIVKIKSITKYVNEMKREAENVVAIERISSSLIGKSVDLRGRKFINEGPLEVSESNGNGSGGIIGSKSSQRYFFLFDTMLLMCEEKKRKGKELQSQFQVKHVFPLLKSIQLLNTIEDNRLFRIITEKKQYVATAPNQKEKDRWIKGLLDALNVGNVVNEMKSIEEENALELSKTHGRRPLPHGWTSKTIATTDTLLEKSAEKPAESVVRVRSATIASFSSSQNP